MNSAVTLLLVVSLVATLFAIRVHSLPTGMPAESDLVITDTEPAYGEVDPESTAVTGARTKRATCDLLSFSSKWVTPNHAACAAHCIVLGKKGGSCKNTICYCRN